VPPPVVPPPVVPPPVVPPPVVPPPVVPPPVVPPPVVPPPVVPPPVVPPPVVSPLPSTSSYVGIWYWTWSSSVVPPPSTNLGITFSGYADPATALTNSQPFFSQLPGTKIMSLGGGNAAGSWTAARLTAVIGYVNSGKFDAYSGISFDIEEGDAGLGSLFSTVFAATKARGKTVIVTTSHSAPYGIPDAAVLMHQFFGDSNIDLMSPQLYTSGSETANDFSESGGIAWSEYVGCKAKLIPSIVTAAMYGTAQQFFQTKGITTYGYIQWQQSNNPPTSAGARCGTSWADATSKCGTPCPTGTDAVCPAGQKCFGALSACPPSANEAVALEESKGKVLPPYGDGIPAWGVALVVLGSILVVLGIALVLVLLRPVLNRVDEMP